MQLVFLATAVDPNRNKCSYLGCEQYGEIYVTPLEHLKAAVDLAGGIPDLAKAATASGAKKVERAHVWNWLHREGRVPGDYVLQVSKAVGFKVSPHDMRPDLYPNASDGLPLTDSDAA